MADNETAFWTGIGALVTAIIGAIVTGFIKMWPVIKEMLQRKESDIAEEMFADLTRMLQNRAEIKASMRYSLERTRCTRVVLLISKNNGGIPSTKGQVKLTIIDEEAIVGVTRVKDQWSDRVATSWYESAVLLNLFTDPNGHLTLRTKNIPETEQLRDVYNVQNVKRSEVYLIGATPNMEQVFISWGYPEDEEPNSMERNLQQATINLIGSIYRKDENLVRFSSIQEAAKIVKASK